MKAILMSIRPEWVAEILNGEKTIEIRKKFPKDYVGWVYIYCTKDSKNFAINYGDRVCLTPTDDLSLLKEGITTMLNGKVVARFWCDKVEKIRSYLEPEQWYMTSDLGGSGLLQKSCLTFKELDDYLLSGDGYAIHIASNSLKVFDKPKEINEFWTSNYNKSAMCDNEPLFPCTKCPNTGALYCNCKFLLNGNCSCVSLTRAPQSWCYIEV